MNLEVSENMHYSSIKIKGGIGAVAKSAPYGGWGGCRCADVPQKYFSLFIGGKDENV
jgi:hypothetical protein